MITIGDPAIARAVDIFTTCALTLIDDLGSRPEISSPATLENMREVIRVRRAEKPEEDFRQCLTHVAHRLEQEHVDRSSITNAVGELLLAVRRTAPGSSNPDLDSEIGQLSGFPKP
jgi:hypothetical protein